MPKGALIGKDQFCVDKIVSSRVGASAKDGRLPMVSPFTTPADVERKTLKSLRISRAGSLRGRV